MSEVIPPPAGFFAKVLPTLTGGSPQCEGRERTSHENINRGIPANAAEPMVSAFVCGSLQVFSPIVKSVFVLALEEAKTLSKKGHVQQSLAYRLAAAASIRHPGSV